MALMNKGTVRFLIATTLICAVILFLLSLYLSSKGENDLATPRESEIVTEKLSSPFVATAEIKLGEVTALVDINRTEAQMMSFSIIEPSYLRDAVISYDSEKINVSYKGVGVDIADNGVIMNSILGLAIDTINSASIDNGLNISMDEGSITVMGENHNGEFALTLNEDTHSILHISVPDLDFECAFTDFIFTPQISVE